MLNEKKLREYLDNKEVWYKIHQKESTVHTADAAAKTGILLERITKSLVCLAGEEGIVCIIPGNCKLDTKKVQKILGNEIKICPYKKAHKFSGYNPGATPPCFYENISKVIIDKKVLEMETTYGGGGTNKSLLEIKPRDIVVLNDAAIEDITL
jgi:Cys-tRNA(Pro) deacylase